MSGIRDEDVWPQAKNLRLSPLGRGGVGFSAQNRVPRKTAACRQKWYKFPCQLSQGLQLPK